MSGRTRDAGDPDKFFESCARVARCSRECFPDRLLGHRCHAVDDMAVWWSRVVRGRAAAMPPPPPWIGFQISGRACRCRAWRNRPRPRSPIGTAALFRWIIDASTANPTSNSSTSAQLWPRLAAGEAAAVGVVLGAGVLPAMTGLAPESGALVVTDGPVLIVGMDPAPALPAEPDCEVLVPLPDPAVAGEVAPLPLDDAGGGGKLERPPVTVSDPASGLSKSTDVGGVGSTG